MMEAGRRIRYAVKSDFERRLARDGRRTGLVDGFDNPPGPLRVVVNVMQGHMKDLSRAKFSSQLKTISEFNLQRRNRLNGFRVRKDP